MLKWVQLTGKVAVTLMMAITALFIFSLLLSPISPDLGPLPLTVAQNAAFVLAAYVSWRYMERRPFTDMGLDPSRWIRPFLHGSTLGLVLIGGLFLLLWLTPWLEVTGLRPAGLITPGLYSALLFLIVAFGEEVFTRGYMQTLLSRSLGSYRGIFTTAILFSALHLQNPSSTLLPMVNLFLAGVLLGVARHVSGGLWLPIGIHFTWNWSQDMLSLPVSGLRISRDSLLTAVETGPNWITGGAFGLEGGAAVIPVLLLGTGWLLYRWRSTQNTSGFSDSH
ncbi:MAG: type II CAAX endopeptidase family protein [Firmicutes bacterium]|uniref:CAAX prenyl protease 2/Lysostaphin resistance protein A-like domain-containing protein n=1 Tax=Melghirimyces thermohalophilus TaxID=1236220 RepID=A0A1G6QD07_9BACL|nr:type II CAAX endopeptidase family protein [Melghirimyces thermohalophilus]MDA8351750.1 type II CAAX endopeptidase family protein [Bacillota bacterium]SDC90370.1 hypothetical protein SAMN04488112_12111 [Melghirimyces thermohalophilus]